MRRFNLLPVIFLIVSTSFLAKAQNYFSQTFDTDPVLSEYQAPNTWYVERYAPAGFQKSFFDGDNRLKLSISTADATPNRPPAYQGNFYNRQGRKYDIYNGPGTWISADLFIGADWNVSHREVDFWAKMGDNSNTFTRNSIIQFINETGTNPRWRVIGNNEWVDIPNPTGFVFGAWYNLKIALTATTIDYYINSQLVYSTSDIGSTSKIMNIIIDAYNFGDPGLPPANYALESYDVYWDNVSANGLNTYTVTYNGNGNTGGTVPTDPNNYASGASVTVLGAGTLVKTGYTFNNWNTSSDGSGTSYAPAATFNISANTTLYAQWTAVPQTLTFNSNGGTEVTAITQDYGTTVTAPADPTKTGYTFGGWYEDDGTFLVAYTFPHTMGLSSTIYAKWTVIQYTITFESNGGSSVTAITQDFGTTVTAPADPTKTGYTFAGWFSDAGLTTPYTFTTMPASNITLYAKWTVVQYTITFESNGGSSVTAITQDFGTTVTAPADPTKTGYTFAGWYSDAGLTTPYTFTTMPASNITLYAKWTVVQYTITFESNGGSSVTAITQDFGTTVTAPADPTKTGYTFAGWFSDAGLTTPYTFTTMPASNITLYAKWTVVQYTITFESNGGSSVTSITQDYGTTVTAPADPTKTGYTFAGWYSDAGLTTPYTFTTMPASNITLYAKWTVIQYTITFESNGGSSVTSITQDFGTTVTAPADPTKTGYTFAGWYSDIGLTTPYTFTTMPASNITLYAKWTVVQYTITFESNGGSSVTSITQDFGTTVTAPADPTKTGYTFAGWFSDAGLTTPYTFTTMPASNITLYAKWTVIQYTITFESNGGSSVTAITQDFGTTVTAPADPTKTGYTFAGWYSDAGLTTPYTFTTMPASNITLYAKWTVIQYTITFESNGGSSVTSITQDYGTTVTAPADPTKTGYTFAGWFSDAGLTTPYTFTTMPASNITLYAKWTVIQYTITFESNGGSSVTAITQDFGTTVTAPADPTKTGYTFAGWFSDIGLTTPYTFTTMPASNITLYAKWTVIQYTITFESNGGSSVTSITQDFGTTVTAPADPTKTGYTFAGWYSDAGLTTPYTFTTMPASNITLYAKWTVIQYTITFESNGGSSVTAITQDYGTTVTAPTDPTKTGYSFAGWFSDIGLTTPYTFTTMPASNITLYAKWTVIQYTITFESNGGSSVTSITQDFGTTVTAPADPTKTGYTFAGWYSDIGLTTPYTFTTMPASNITLYAKWTVIQYTITFESNGGSSVASITQDFGTTVTAPADPTKTGYTFAGWYSDIGLTTPYTFTTMPASNITLYAKWTVIQYTITFESNGGSSVTAITQDFGTTVTAPC